MPFNVNDITVGEIVSGLTILLFLGGILTLLFGLWYRFGKLERQAAHRQDDTEMSFKCHRASLEAHIGNGANGSVKSTLDELNDYITAKASGKKKKEGG